MRRIECWGGIFLIFKPDSCSLISGMDKAKCVEINTLAFFSVKTSACRLHVVRFPASSHISLIFGYCSGRHKGVKA